MVRFAVETLVVKITRFVPAGGTAQTEPSRSFIGLFRMPNCGHIPQMLTLAITGFDADPNRVTDTLGIEPTSIGRLGEPLRSGRPRTFNGWWKDVEPERLVNARQHADAMVRMLDYLRGREGHFAQLRKEIEPRKVSIYGGLYIEVNQQCGVFLDPEQMRLLADCGVGWGLDLFADR
jgi:hypothetical protein